MRRPLSLLVAILALVPLTACGDDGGETDTEGGEVRTTPVQFGEGDEVWFRVQTGGGYVPYLVNLREVPGLLLFDDGRLVRLVEDEDDPSPTIPRFEVVPLDEEGAAEMLGTFAAVVDGPDPGDPSVTDLGTRDGAVTGTGDVADRQFLVASS